MKDSDVSINARIQNIVDAGEKHVFDIFRHDGQSGYYNALRDEVTHLGAFLTEEYSTEELSELDLHYIIHKLVDRREAIDYIQKQVLEVLKDEQV